MPRQTDLSLEELVANLDDAQDACCHASTDPLPLGLVVNEIGEIFNEGGENGARAEVELALLLGDERENAHWIASMYLRNAKKISGETALALDQFRTDPANAELMRR